MHDEQEEKHGDKQGWSAVNEGESKGGDVGEVTRSQTTEGLVRKCVGGFEGFRAEE